MQTGEPVPHAIVAVDAQGLVEAQSAPALQSVQMPALHTWFVPQGMPLATGIPSRQTGLPEPQVVVPVMHVFTGVQVDPLLQGRH